ncbi:3-phosphoglycerate dehydrogenase [Asanoa ishikariensis]|uniref:D-3-phosphoglycerate dehydrogenase n=1 Tax=Asanoa ishikariensis TaxID=137265 RepID=A0A1H3TGU3_9ACTN|nr:C-terminal binding protein [Asanoa ishikariensis]GIF62591.1 3-phosphoglycerate dehydrogenase [Asanoa ishikariensis]SDZ48549.1 D-3-phosphoglycerate dehydrogenase [Asanoa ishikariensis]
MSTVVQLEYVGDLAPYDEEEAALAEAGAALKVVRAADGDALVEAAADADVIWVEWTPHLTRDVLERLPRLGLAIRWGVGYEQIDVAAATELGIAVANAPAYCTEDVAEHALAMLLAVSRQVVYRDRQGQQGLWRHGPARQKRLAGSTVGVVGLGRIGRHVARVATAFGATVLGYDPVVRSDDPAVRQVGFEELLAASDFVSVHVPLTPETHHLFDADSLSLMRPDAALVNTSRGGVVSQAALVEALDAGRIGAAALDVFEQEPLPAENPLRGRDNVILTPHEAANSPQSGRDLRRAVYGATVQWLRTGWTDSIVNPQVRPHARAAR